ncbi:MAG: pitrilysin family protein [Bacteroidota bacterium]|nr:pitrilysin family protein [Bacteroidota bacterium]
MHRYRLSHALFLFLLAACTSAQIPPIAYEKYELANGLDVILRVDKKIPAVGVVLWYHVGSKNERPGRTGFAHLFEHMMFQGSKNAKGEYLQRAEEAGGRANGSTTWDRTNYFETVPREALEYALWLESDRMGYLLDAVTEEDLKNQQDVVKNEKRQGDNAPYAVVQYLIADHLYPKGHPYDHTVIGSMEDLSAASLEDVKDFFRTWYTPNNCTLALVGDFDPAEAKRLVQKYFGPIPAGPPLVRSRVNIPVLPSTRVLTATDNVPQARLYLVYPVPPQYTPDDAPLDFAAAILGQGKTSILYRKLVRELELASDVSVSNSGREISGEFHITVTARPGVSLDDIRKAVDAEIAAFAKSGPSADELAREKARIESRFISRLERLGGFGGVGDQLCAYNTFLGDPAYFEKDYARYMHCTENAVKAAFGRWVASSPRLEILVYPENAKRPDAKDFDRSTPPPIPPVAPFSIPPITHRTLANGLDIVVAERHDLPLVSASLQIRTANLLEGPDKAGESAMTADLLDEGANGQTAAQIVDALSRIGARLSVSGGRTGASAQVTALKKHMSEAFRILADVVLRPDFPKKEFEQRRKLVTDELRREKSNPQAIASRIFEMVLFGRNHPLGIPDRGTEESLKRLTVDDLRANHATYWRPNNATLIFAGDITMDEAAAFAERYFGAWQSRPIPKHEMPPFAPPAEHTVYLVDRPGAPQSQIRIGSLAPPRSTPDYYALEVMNMLLGGSFSSRINLNLRERKGYTYGARTSMTNEREHGSWAAATGVQTKVTKDALAELRNEIEGISGPRPVSEQELESTRNAMTRSYAQNFESGAALLAQLGSMISRGVGFEELEKFVPSVLAQTPASVMEAAKKHIDFSKCLTVVVGDLAKIEEDVRALGWGKVVVLDADGLLVR